MRRKSKKILLIFCIASLLLVGVSALINATNVIENEIFIEFKDKNLFDAVKNYFSDKANKITYNANEETLTIRGFTR